MEKAKTIASGLLIPFVLIASIFTLSNGYVIGFVGLQQEREPIEEHCKAYLLVKIEDISLVWNGDQGEGGRGRGEVFVNIWITWPCAVEGTDTEYRVLGPLGGNEEFPSGNIVEDPPSSGKYKVIPATVKDLELSKFRYYKEADCPVATTLLIEVLVWEQDDAGANFQAIIDNAVKAAAAKGGNLAGQVIQAMLNRLGQTGDDALGRFTGLVQIPDACAESFSVTRSLELENLAANLWKSVDAEDENGVTFKSKGIEPPLTIGSLKLKIIGGPKENKKSSHYYRVHENESYTILTGVNLGQPDEVTIATILSLDAPLPYEPLSVRYSFFLDIDNDLATGAQGFPVQGAEYELRREFQNSESSVASLFVYNPFTLKFEEVPEGLYDAFIDISRTMIFMSVELERLGNPSGSIAGWGVVGANDELLNVLPSNPENTAPTISLNPCYSGVPPLVIDTIPSACAIDVNVSTICITFSKAMNRAQTEAAFSITPLKSGSFAWQGNTLFFAPSSSLQPCTQYNVTINSSAIDRVGVSLDGNGDLISGDSFTWSFITQTLSLFSCSVTGVEKTQFIEDEIVYVTGESLPASTQIDLYLIAHNRTILTALFDITDDGPNTVMTDDQGRLSPTNAGSISESGEANIIVDINRNGLFDPQIDRIDKVGIGFYIVSLGVAIKKIDLQKTIVGQGYSTMINVTIANPVELSQIFDVTLYADATAVAALAGINLTGINSTTLTFTWNTASFAKSNYTISAYAWPVPDETDMEDNNCSDGWVLITKVGDIGGGLPPKLSQCDGKVDAMDLALFIQCYKGLVPPIVIYLGDFGGGVPPQFYLCDGVVDGKDLALFIQCYKGLGP